MSPTNGHASGAVSIHAGTAQQFAPASDPNVPTGLTATAASVKDLIANLEVPFHPSVIEWRVTNASKSGPPRGQVMPYADQRAYTDRLNALVTPAGWTRRYAVHTSANFERSKDKKIVAKVLVTCELTIFGLGSHSATGEQWADDPNAGTSAEAQAFKRAAACFGLGRYLYYFTGSWVDLDDHKRPKSVPQLAGWATPSGWRQGIRPCPMGEQESAEPRPPQHARKGDDTDIRDDQALRAIKGMELVVGRHLYRGMLKTVARVWNPVEIKDSATREKVLKHLQAAERGLARARTARHRVAEVAFQGILKSLRLTSIEQVDSLKTLHELVVALETATATAR
jgi:hypothetical protein